MDSSPFPAQLGYRMPAEWEPHAGTWLSWPREQGISFPDQYDKVPPIYAALIRTLVQSEPVDLNVWDASMEATVRQTLEAHGVPLDHVSFHHIPAYEPWCRDHGPIFLVREYRGRRERAVVDWDYNAWGGKYPPYELDDLVPRRVADLRSLPLFHPGLVLEGGSIEVNGHGVLLTTESCLLNSNRNPQQSQSEIAQALRDYLGVTHVHWLGGGIVGDDTDGHIDCLARFLNARTIAAVIEENVKDANYPILQENLRRLRTLRDQDGHLFRIVKLPMPEQVENRGQRLPASYANFYITNSAVIVPTFQSPRDAEVLEILQREFSHRRVIGLDSLDLIWGLGSFHCLTQQEPAP